MDTLAAIKREERKLEKQLVLLQHRLNRIRAAANALGDSNLEISRKEARDERGSFCDRGNRNTYMVKSLRSCEDQLTRSLLGSVLLQAFKGDKNVSKVFDPR